MTCKKLKISGYNYGILVNVIVMIITGAVYISQLLTATRTLQDLNMRDNDVGDEGIKVISEALQHNKSLTSLWILECGLSVKGTVICGFS